LCILSFEIYENLLHGDHEIAELLDKEVEINEGKKIYTFSSFL
jgi:hypothetical protein